MSQSEVFAVPAAWARRAQMTAERYDEACARAVRDPDAFWREVSGRLDWIKPPTRVKDVSFNKDDFHISWFADGALNVAANCLDRHLATRAGDIAIIWEGDEPGEERKITYGELHADVCRMANVMKANGVKRGDRVTIYMPMIPETPVAMLACARIGAVHSVVFAGFSAESLAGRILDCDSRFVITADEGLRGGRRVRLKGNVDDALKECPAVDKVLVVQRTFVEVDMVAGRDLAWAQEREKVSADCPAEAMGAV